MDVNPPFRWLNFFIFKLSWDFPGISNFDIIIPVFQARQYDILDMEQPDKFQCLLGIPEIYLQY